MVNHFKKFKFKKIDKIQYQNDQQCLLLKISKILFQLQEIINKCDKINI